MSRTSATWGRRRFISSSTCGALGNSATIATTDRLWLALRKSTRSCWVRLRPRTTTEIAFGTVFLVLTPRRPRTRIVWSSQLAYSPKRLPGRKRGRICDGRIASGPGTAQGGWLGHSRRQKMGSNQHSSQIGIGSSRSAIRRSLLTKKEAMSLPPSHDLSSFSGYLLKVLFESALTFLTRPTFASPN